MQRDWNMDEVSNGKKYKKEDFVELECDDCSGCSACCHGMGTSITLDPYDVFSMTQAFSCHFQDLLANGVELNIVDSLILPNLKMQEESGSCRFLNEKERCSIHSVRPGICRLFPLGRIYENGDFSYFLQVNECQKKERGKVSIRQWLDVPNMKKYEKFICEWHYFLLDWSKMVNGIKEEQERKNAMMILLVLFFQKDYDSEKDFYPQFYERLEKAKELINE